jgi:nitroimidazol reductase NimA-like FMN-containing flavoprotein (pyridoxamine 5'-phosphate oxidase superfamily)
MNASARSRLRRIPKRGSHDPAILREILDAALLAHVGFQVNGQPFVIPTIFGRENDTLYLHGSVASRMLGRLEAGVPACVTVTLLDGLVLARSAFHHSMNYRSVVAFGTARRIADPEEQTRALRIISEHVLAGRWNDVRAPTRKELNATAVLAFTIEEASAKVRQGPPLDDERDYALPVWAGVLPFRLESQEPIADPRLAPGAALPPYLRRAAPDAPLAAPPCRPE